MNQHWERVTEPLLRALEPRVVCEIGAQHGAQTEHLLALCAEIDAVAHVIDPAPTFDVDEWGRRHGERFRFHRARSLEVLHELDDLDAVLIDGDHNWYTVFNELQVLDRIASASGRTPPLALVHDVRWPYGRRDMYYAPDDIPPEHRHPHARRPLVPDEPGVATEGLNGHLCNALTEGGGENGILTAVEDFLGGTTGEWQLQLFEGFHGLGALIPSARSAPGSALAQELERLESAPALRETIAHVERARVEAEIEAARWRGRAETATARARDAEQAAQRAARDAGLLRSELSATRAALADVPGLHAQLLNDRHELTVERRRRERLELALERDRRSWAEALLGGDAGE
jgi:hypothetical protein